MKENLTYFPLFSFLSKSGEKPSRKSERLANSSAPLLACISHLPPSLSLSQDLLLDDLSLSLSSTARVGEGSSLCRTLGRLPLSLALLCVGSWRGFFSLARTLGRSPLSLSPLFALMVPLGVDSSLLHCFYLCRFQVLIWSPQKGTFLGSSCLLFN